MNVTGASLDTGGQEGSSSKRKFFDLSLGYKYDRYFLILLFVSIAFRVLWLDVPNGYGVGGALIFDEYYYVNVARILLGWPQGPDPSKIPYPNALPGTDPNVEAPPLAKLLIAASMRILGDNAWGWRLPSVIMGSLSILLFYLLLKRISSNGRFSLLATFLLSFDNLIFIQSRVAMLDIFALGFMLLGFYLYFLERPKLSAIALALSTLSKIIGLYGFLTIVIFQILRELPRDELAKKWKSLLFAKMPWLFRFSFYYLATGFLLLIPLSRLRGYANAFADIVYIYNVTRALATPAPTGFESQPLQWLLNQVPILYYGLSVSTGGVTYPIVAFMALMNPFIIYMTVPAMAYALYRYDQRNSQLALFLLCWFAATYFPFFPLSYIGHRISFIFYFQDSVPAVAGGIALLLSNKHVPRSILLVYVLLVLVGFAWYFPFKKIPP
jgi:predicted membrane-bound dolichyl-phosphate-mannose-protein mannosyltransferase